MNGVAFRLGRRSIVERDLFMEKLFDYHLRIVCYKMLARIAKSKRRTNILNFLKFFIFAFFYFEMRRDVGEIR